VENSGAIMVNIEYNTIRQRSPDRCAFVRLGGRRNRMDIFEAAAWAAIGSFIVAFLSIVREVWRSKMRSDHKVKRPRK